MNSAAPATWRDDLHAALPWVDAARAAWLGNLNAAHPWRTIVGDIRLADGQPIVLKYHRDLPGMQREWVANRLIEEAGGSSLAPRWLGGDEARRVLVFERLAGPPLNEVLDGRQARTTWLEAARAVADLHRGTADRTSHWLELCPEDATSDRLPVYNLPFDELVAPFVQVGANPADVEEAVTAARQAMAEPGPWLGFTHGDLQTRHMLCTLAGPRIVDWERAGLRHRLYDLACLLSKPINHGRRLPRWAEEAAVTEYARVCALDPEELRAALTPVLAYELLIGVAEHPRGETGPAEARARLDGLLEWAPRDRRLAALTEPAAALRDLLLVEDLPLCAGLDGEGVEADGAA